jgi:hypothetical protein
MGGSGRDVPIQSVNAGGMRALDTVDQPYPFSNYRPEKRYSGFGMKPLGSPIGAGYSVVAGVDAVLAAHR